MRALKRLIAIVGGTVVGIALLVFGVKDYFQSKALKSNGKNVVAEVTDAEERSGRRGRKKYYLTVNFKTESGHAVSSRERVSRGIYEEGSSSRKISVTYLPEKPDVFRVGEVSTSWANFGFGVVMLGVAVVSAFSRSE